MGVVDMIQLEGGPADTLYQSLQGTSLGVWMLWVYYILFYNKPFNADPGRRQVSRGSDRWQSVVDHGCLIRCPPVVLRVW